MLCLLLISSASWSQSSDTLTLRSEVSAVTVFLQGAQITRQARASLAKGTNYLVLPTLSPFLDPQSIQVKADGDITILSVNHQIDFLQKPEKSRLEKRIETVQDSLDYQKAMLAVVEEEEQVLKENRSIGGSQTGYTLPDLKAISAYYADRLKAIKIEALAIQKATKDYQQTLTQLRRQLKELNSNQTRNASNIIVTVSSERPQSLPLEVSYLAGNAGWYPTYDLRVKDVENPIALTYKANVHQNTGENWNKVKLTFSNANPNQNNVLPALNTYYLGFDRRISIPATYQNMPPANPNIRQVSGQVVSTEGETLPGTNVLVKGTSVGTVTDVNGKYALSIPMGATTLVFSTIGYLSQELPVSSAVMNVALEADVRSLQEVVVTGYGAERRNRRKATEDNIVPATPMINQTTVSFAVTIPYSIPSDGENYVVGLAAYDVPADYEYQSIPKLDQDAFLVASITGWDEYNLLEGEANLFFEGTYVGKSLLDVRYAEDTLHLSLGKDKNVSVKREKIKDYNRKPFIGANRISKLEDHSA